LKIADGVREGLNRCVPEIRVLSDILASQVAAGEVVERPASVVKELVENSLDAGAREVLVDIEKGGGNLIRVSDDGRGMTREDALLSLERHATSKLRSSEDLATIMTLGFRGEAVPSIASVTKFRLTTRPADSLTGTEIVVDGGKVRDVRESGGAPGTVIEARQLFFNIPARRKFMRTENTESAHVEQQVKLHALAAPKVRFRFRKDDRTVFDFPGVARTADRVRQLIGNELGGELMEIPTGMGNGMRLEGFILPAQHARKGRRHQYVFLNGRPIEDAAVSKGLAEGFRGNLQEGLHPAAWLWLEIEPKLVDVNVHPAKKEVRFHRPFELRELISQAVVNCLRPRPVVSKTESGGDAAETPSEAVSSGDTISAERGPMFHPTQNEFTIEAERSDPSDKPASRAPAFRLIGMLQERYVILESDDGLVLFDPKAAQERIIFEQLTKARAAGMETQNLLVPVLIELDARDLDLLLREKLALLEAGLEIEAFGGNTLQLRSIPAFLEMEDPKSFLDEILEETLHGPASAGKFAFERLSRIIASKAAKRVVPRLVEAKDLLDQLFACDLPYCAADGRPTLTEYNRKDIDRRFGVGRG
jgi:DNA mismatch repair protein MutL